MGVGPEHISADIAPHHEFDHAFRHLFFNEMRDAAVSEDMRRDMFFNACMHGDDFEMLVDGRMDEGPAMHVHEDQCIPARVRFVTGPPLCQVFVRHDEPDVPGHVGLEVHVRNYAVFIEREIAPGHGPDLADAEPAFVSVMMSARSTGRVHAFIMAVISSGVSRSAATLVMGSLAGLRSLRSLRLAEI